jgi:hypothetical protein
MLLLSMFCLVSCFEEAAGAREYSKCVYYLWRRTAARPFVPKGICLEKNLAPEKMQGFFSQGGRASCSSVTLRYLHEKSTNTSPEKQVFCPPILWVTLWIRAVMTAQSRAGIGLHQTARELTSSRLA